MKTPAGLLVNAKHFNSLSILANRVLHGSAADAPVEPTAERSVRPVLVIDGTESMEGRATFVISALFFCLDWLPRVHLRVADVSNENVVTALDAFRYDHGLPIDIRHASDRSSPLAGADLYAAVAFLSAGHLRLEEARKNNIPTLLALQYPGPEWVSPSILLRHEAAFNPRIFAEHLTAIVTPWL